MHEPTEWDGRMTVDVQMFICSYVSNMCSSNKQYIRVCRAADCLCCCWMLLLAGSCVAVVVAIPFAQRNSTLLSLADAEQTIRSNLSFSYHLFVAVTNLLKNYHRYFVFWYSISVHFIAVFLSPTNHHRNTISKVRVVIFTTVYWFKRI